MKAGIIMDLDKVLKHIAICSGHSHFFIISLVSHYWAHFPRLHVVHSCYLGTVVVEYG